MEESHASSINLTNADSTVVSSSSGLLESSKEENIHSTSERATCVNKEQRAEEPYWKNLTNMTFRRSRFGSAVHDNKIYIFGGVFTSKEENILGKRTNMADIFDLQTNSWTELPNMRRARCNCSCAVVGDNIYIIGGEIKNEKSMTNHCEVFNINTKTWSTMPPMKNETSQHSSAAIGKMIFVFGGRNGRGLTVAYDTVARKWIAKSKMNVNRYSFASAVANNKIYAIGGMREFPPGKYRVGKEYYRYVETMEEYDIVTDKWVISKQKMRNRRAGCSAVTIGSTIKIIGGQDEEGLVSSIETFDTLQEKWSGCIIPPSKDSRRHFAAKMIGDSLVVIGGMNDSDLFLNSIEKFSLPRDPTIRLSIPAINELSNIDPNQICLDHLFQTKKCTDVPIKCSGIELRDTPRKSCNLTKEKHSRGIKRKVMTLKQSNKKKKPQNNSRSKKTKTKHNCVFIGAKVVKHFEDGTFRGIVTSFDDNSEFWKVEYEDGDSEEMGQEDVEMAMQDYNIEFGKEKEKRKKVTTRTTPTKESEKRGKRKERKKVNKANNNRSLKEQMNAKAKNIGKLEMEILGKTRKGPLQNRSDRLKAALTEMEKKAFGKVQTGNFQYRFESLKSASGGNNLI